MAGQVPFLPPDFEPKTDMILIEGETDTMATWQAMSADARANVSLFGLSGTNAWKTEYVERYFAEAKRVYVVFDNDDPYTSEDAVKQTDKAWAQIRKDLGRRARRVKLPQGTNDLAEFFQRYDWAALAVLLKNAAKPHMNFPRLDLTRDPPPPDWLVHELIDARDISVLYGQGGVSKSLWMQALAVAIANGDGEFMGMKIPEGRVLYVDKENPEDVALSRLKKLGLTDKGRENLYYTWYPQIDLLREPEKLFEDVTEWDPCVAMLDSFARVTPGGEFNEAVVVDLVFDRSLYPITRELLVPVIVLHHENKDGGMRGSVQIRNSADLSLQVVQAMDGKEPLENTFRMFPDKPRRGQKTHVTYQVVAYDADDDIAEGLDDEVRIQLERRDEMEDTPY